MPITTALSPDNTIFNQRISKKRGAAAIRLSMRHSRRRPEWAG